MPKTNIVYIVYTKLMRPYCYHHGLVMVDTLNINTLYRCMNRLSDFIVCLFSGL